MLKNKVAKNALWIIGCRVVQAFLALVVNLLTARYLGPSNYGLISYAASLVAFVLPVMQLGINNTLVSEIMADPNKEGETIGTSIALTSLSAIACIIAIAGFVLIANRGEIDTLVVCVLYSLLLIAQSFELVQYWFQAKLLSKYTSLTILAVYVVVSAYKIYLLATQKSVYWFAVSNAIDYILIAMVLIVIYKRLGGQRFKFSYQTAKKIFSSSKHYIVAGIMGTVLAQTDRIMLKTMYGNDEVGFYSAAVSIATLSSFVFSAIIDSMRPSILKNKENNTENYEKNVCRLYSIIIYLALAQSVVISAFAKHFVWLLYGEAYLPTVSTLQIVVWYTMFTYIGAVRAVWILAEKKQKYLWKVSLLGMVMNVCLNMIFIPLWSINGAAIATLITQVFSNVIVNYIVKPFRTNNKLIFKGLNIKNMFK